MDYANIYFQLTSRAKNRILEGYTEKHHILPRSLGGTNKKENIVRFTVREHFLAHLCLWKMSEGEARKKMAYAVVSFKRQRQCQKGKGIRFNSRTYEIAKKERNVALSRKFSGEGNPNFGGKYTSQPDIQQRMRVKKSSTENMGKYERTNEVVKKNSQNRKGKGLGIRNAMSDPIHRAKVGVSKVGKKLHIGPNGERKMFIPNTAPEGYTCYY